MAYVRLSYHHRLFLLLLSFSWVVVTIFVVFQYERERDYKASQLNGLLQYYNARVGDLMTTDSLSSQSLALLAPPLGDTRVSVIDKTGKVLFDNTLDNLDVGNHIDRPEVREALDKGSGFTLRRHSASTNDNYFYSATRCNGLIVRSAVPYNLTLSRFLAADKGFLWFMTLVTILMSVAAWFATRPVANTVARLNRFASKAERGEPIYADETFPQGELGEISRHIVMLYAQRERRHEESLRQERDKVRIKKQLTNNINHELKTPLAAMQVCLETLLSHPELPPERQLEFLNRCWNNSERLRGLLSDVSTLTRLDDGSAMIACSPVNLTKVVADTVERFSAPGMLPVALQLPADDILIPGNASLLASVIENLIRNANAYSHGTAISIIMRQQSDGSTSIDFHDDGVGIPEEHLPHIFERFYRIDKGRSRAAGGTGLGLAIVKNAVLFHGGTITAFNRPQGGLAFSIILPAEGHPFS